MSFFTVGVLVRLSAAFLNAAGTAADPSTVTFRYRTPAGTVTTLVYGVDGALVKASTGNYHVDLAIPNTVGEWTYRWSSTGDPSTAADGSFTVPPSPLA